MAKSQHARMAHIPVLLQDCLKVLAPSSGEFFIDGTLGGGGHTLEIIERLQPGGIFLGIDKDPGAVSNFQSVISGKYFALERIILKSASYSDLESVLDSEGLRAADGLLLDLGFSSEQIRGGALSGRGFSFSADEPLLMTYNPQHTPLRELLTKLDEAELEKIITEYGEERYSGPIAAAVAKKASQGMINTTFDLVRAIESATPKSYEHGRIHPATRTFQALRIYTNNELNELKQILEKITKIIAIGGRVAVISFHS